MVEEYITVPNPSVPGIPGVLVVPSNPQSAVLLLHGLFGSKDEYNDAYRKLAADLSEAVIASLRIDFRGHGDSGAALAEYTSQSQALDAVYAFDWLRGRLPDLPTSVLATSFGAAAGITLATVRDEVVTTLVLVAPVLDYARTFLYPTTEWGNDLFGIKRVAESVQSGLPLEDGYTLSPEATVDLLDVNPGSALPRLGHKDVHILHGERDSLVPHEISIDVARELDWIDLHIMPNTDHGLAEVGDASRSSAQTRKNIARVIRYLRRSDE